MPVTAATGDGPRPLVCILSQLANESLGGPGRQTVLLARSLVAHGFEVLVVARRIRGVEADALPPGCRVVTVPGPFPGRVNLERASVGNLLVSLGYTLGAAAVIVSNRRITLVHSQGASLPFVLLAPLVRALGRPLVALPSATGQGVEAGDFRGRYLGLGRLFLRAIRPAHFVAISARIEQALRRDGLESIVRIPVIIDEQRFRPAAGDERAELRRRFGYTGRTLLFVGRLVPRKRPTDLIAALARAASAAPELALEVLGDGPLRPEVERAIAAHGLEERVTLRGFRDDVPERLRAADGFVLCSDIEGLPNVLLEALASGAPVLATRISGVEDLIADGENGLLVAPGDVEALARGLVHLGTEDLGPMREAARRTIVERYSQEAVVRRYVELYRSLL